MSNKKTLVFFIGGLVLGALLTAGIMLSQEKKKAIDVSAAIGTPLFKVDNKVYTTSDLPGDAAMEYYMLENNIYSAKQNFSNQIALRILLAKDAQKPVNSSTLPKIEELLNMKPVTEFEAKQYYDKILAQMGKNVFGGQTFDQIKTQLIARMNQQKNSEVVSTKLQELQSGGRIQVLLKQPTAPSVSLDVASYPARGNLNSSVTLVEVADYLCPHCREAESTIESLYKQFDSKIKFVHVSFPLAPEGLSGALARGAFCANKQGQDKFWKYHAAAFQVPWEKNQVPTGLDATTYYNNITTEVGQNSGVDSATFSTCLTSNEAKDYIKNVQATFNESKGFQGTPTFYLNNKIIQASPEQLSNTLQAALNK